MARNNKKSSQAPTIDPPAAETPPTAPPPQVEETAPSPETKEVPVEETSENTPEVREVSPPVGLSARVVVHIRAQLEQFFAEFLGADMPGVDVVGVMTAVHAGRAVFVKRNPMRVMITNAEFQNDPAYLRAVSGPDALSCINRQLVKAHLI